MGDRRPNEGLRRLHRETGWTLRQFALAVNRLATERGRPTRYEPPSVHQRLAGHLPRDEARPLILEALARHLHRPVTHAEAGFPPPPTSGADVGTVEGLLDLGRSDMDPSRRSVVGASLFSAALAVPGWQDVIGRMEAIQRGQVRRIGVPEVDMVVAMTEQMSNLDDQFGGRHARPMAAAFLVNTVAPYLRADATEEVRRAMMSAASHLCCLTGYMAVDEGMHGVAQQYYVKALELAGAAEDHMRFSGALREMSVQAVDLRHGPEALRLADAAAAASPQAGPRMRAFLVGQQAHASAQVGDRRNAVAYLRDADTAMEKAESGNVPGRYTPAALQDHISHVRFELGDMAGSVEALKQADSMRAGIYRGTRVRKRGLLAEHQFAIGHLEAACTTWHMVLDDFPSVHSGRADQRVREMFRLIRPHLKNATARGLHERARVVAPRLAA
ncbi:MULTISPECIES: tetratricopeptide repeat protein [unclassified Streptomyces]|uniref:tetratricopeptide repeat protein n=1 Tax=unclassified Streptomyces TaxID=2593676 RepID=UPI002E28F13C|nr:tetratricopeptide repeat protein [Streptomyces sp. NBC_00223]